MSGEEAAAAWYEARGFEMLDRNWRCREGELDLVLAKRTTIVFCEVKTRRGNAYGAPFEAVTHTKQRRLRVLAARWLDAHPQRGCATSGSTSRRSRRVPADEFEVEVIEAAF